MIPTISKIYGAFKTNIICLFIFILINFFFKLKNNLIIFIFHSTLFKLNNIYLFI